MKREHFPSSPESVDRILSLRKTKGDMSTNQRRALRIYIDNTLAGAGNSHLSAHVASRVTRIREALGLNPSADEKLDLAQNLANEQSHAPVVREGADMFVTRISLSPQFTGPHIPCATNPRDIAAEITSDDKPFAISDGDFAIGRYGSQIFYGSTHNLVGLAMFGTETLPPDQTEVVMKHMRQQLENGGPISMLGVLMYLRTKGKRNIDRSL